MSKKSIAKNITVLHAILEKKNIAIFKMYGSKYCNTRNNNNTG